MIDGVIFDIQRYCLHDGPGIRSVVFLKDCPLRCRWCSNPEGQGAGPELEFFPSRCKRCGRCVEACRPGALAMSGRLATVGEVMAEVTKDTAFYRKSAGGVTRSGGEPLAQPAFARALLERCRDANIHTAIETCGHALASVFRAVVEPADLVLYDLKHADPGQHLRLTGVSNGLVLENLRMLAGMGKPIVARVPLIPGWNDAEANLRAIGGLLATLGIRELHLMPFHQLGKDKYGRLGKHYTLANLPAFRGTEGNGGRVSAAKQALQAFGLDVHIGG